MITPSLTPFPASVAWLQGRVTTEPVHTGTPVHCIGMARLCGDVRLTEGSRYRRGLVTTDGDTTGGNRAVAAALSPIRLKMK